jgi:hypothetical protein
MKVAFYIYPFTINYTAASNIIPTSFNIKNGADLMTKINIQERGCMQSIPLEEEEEGEKAISADQYHPHSSCPKEEIVPSLVPSLLRNCLLKDCIPFPPDLDDLETWKIAKYTIRLGALM